MTGPGSSGDGDGDGPEDFFHHIGFEVIGETPYGEHVAGLTLASSQV